MKDTVKIAILGDICPTKDYRCLFDVGEQAVFGDILGLIKQADLSVANLECAIAGSEKPITKCGPCLKAENTDVELIKRAGIQMVSLANNHIKDYGPKGVLQTMDCLEKNGIKWFGAGRSLDKLQKVTFVNIKGIKVGFASFTEKEFNLATEVEAGAAEFDPYESIDDIRRWKKGCDYLIILYHGGIEHYQYPSPLLQKKCRKMAEEGADVVLCQHSHCVGTYENWNGCDILYGQGNGVFGYRKGNDKWNEGLLVELELTSESKRVSFRLLNATEKGIHLAKNQQEAVRIGKMKRASEKLNDKEWLCKSWKDFCKKNVALNYALLYGKNRVFNKLNRVCNNKLLGMLIGKKQKMITMNLIRCDAWREVITTMLEGDIYDK